ncbi:acetyl-coenzyme A synthetase, partial [Neobacillus drentensis]|uniref:AMP-binding enzyme n=1 Tax=Neobacillus drentensis TaxID=220684 RepID=UPI003047BE26
DLKEKINENIIQLIGKIALPKSIIFTETLPKTVSGKIMRRLLKEIFVSGKVSGDITGLEDPATVAQIQMIINEKSTVK